METINTTESGQNNKKHIRGWSLVSTLAAFAVGWAVAFAVLQSPHWMRRTKPVADAAKPVVNAVRNAVDSLTKPAAPEATSSEAAKSATADKPAVAAAQVETEQPAPASAAPVVTTKTTLDTAHATATGNSEIDEREAIKRAFQRNIETVRVLTSR